MPKLSDVIGALMADLAHARRVADEQSALLADAYRREPLLQGLSVPRLRLQSVLIDMPALVDGYAEGTEERVASPHEVATVAAEQLTGTAHENKTPLPTG